LPSAGDGQHQLPDGAAELHSQQTPLVAPSAEVGMIPTSVLRAMQAAGATAEMILAAIEADEKANAEGRAKRREQNRINQRNHRACHQESALTSDDKQLHTLTTDDAIPPTPPIEKDSLSKKESFLLTSSDSSLEKKEGLVVARESKPRANRGQTVPADMQLSIKNLDYALSQGWQRDRAFREWNRFRDGSIAKGRVYKNIDAGWRNWVTSPFQKETPNGKFNLMSGIDGVI